MPKLKIGSAIMERLKGKQEPLVRDQEITILPENEIDNSEPVLQEPKYSNVETTVGSSPVKEVESIVDTGLFLGVEVNENGYQVVGLDFVNGILEKTNKGKPTKIRAQAVEQFKLSSFEMLARLNNELQVLLKNKGENNENK